MVARAARVLRAWDDARAAAYSRGSTSKLRWLYVDGAGVSDLRLLRDYARRDLRIVRMEVQVLAVDVLGHTPQTWRLRVTDRLSRVVVAAGRSTRTVLPRDQASTRIVHLVRRGETWRVAAVRHGGLFSDRGPPR